MKLPDSVLKTLTPSSLERSAKLAKFRKDYLFNGLRWVCIVLILAIVIVQPVSKIGLNHNWSDQSKFYDALDAALKGKRNSMVDEGWVGPGYVTAAVLVNRVFSIRPEDSLVLLNRLSYLGTLAVVGLFVMFLWQPRDPACRPGSILSVVTGFVYLLCVIHGSNLTFFSDVPWSHFVSSFFIVLIPALLLAISRAQSLTMKCVLLFIAGTSLGMLTAVRFFDGVIVALGLLLSYVLLIVQSRNRVETIRVLATAGTVIVFGSVIAFSLCFYVSHASRLSLLYLSINTINPILIETFPSTFFQKFFQIFVDPSFNTSLRPLVFRNALQMIWDPTLGDWQMPVLFQGPILLYGLVMLIPISMCAFVMKRRDDSPAMTCVRAMLIIAVLLLVGYTTPFFSGSPHLVFGMIRGYMPVIWCLAVICSPSAGQVWLPKVSSRAQVGLLSVCLGTLIVGQTFAAHGIWPVYRSHHIARTIVNPRCNGRDCSLSLSYVNRQGVERNAATDIVLVQIDCDGKRKEFTLRGPEYRFQAPVCSGQAEGLVMPRMTGYASIPIDSIPNDFRFRLPAPNVPRDKYTGTFVFGAGSSFRSLLTMGWAGDEVGFVWTAASHAEINIPYESRTSENIEIDLEIMPFVGAFTDGAPKEQIVIISLNDQPGERFVLAKNLEHIHLSRRIDITHNLNVSFELPNAASPISLGIGSDPRSLGIALRRITISSDKAN